MSGQTLRFSELTTAADEELHDEPKKGIEIEIEVAGPKEVSTKTVQLKLDQRGLIQLSFKEGGELPVLLQGRFTDIENVKIALTIWKDKTDKEFKLDANVSKPKSGDQSLSDVIDEVVAESAPPGFEEKLDVVLTKTEEIEDDSIVILD